MSLIKRSLPEDIDITDPSVRWEYEGAKPVMKDITVPKAYKHLLKRDRTPEYDEAVIRDYIKAHPGEVITGAKFTEVLDGLTTAPTIIRKLMKKGNVVRHHFYDGSRGAKYTYTWVDSPRPVIAEPKPELHIPLIDPVETKEETTEQDDTLKDIDWNDPVTEDVIYDDMDNTIFKQMLDQYFLDFSDSSVNASDLIGANTFRKYVKTQIDLAELKSAINREQ